MNVAPIIANAVGRSVFDLDGRRSDPATSAIELTDNETAALSRGTERALDHLREAAGLEGHPVVLPDGALGVATNVRDFRGAVIPGLYKIERAR